VLLFFVYVNVHCDRCEGFAWLSVDFLIFFSLGSCELGLRYQVLLLAQTKSRSAQVLPLSNSSLSKFSLSLSLSLPKLSLPKLSLP